MYQLYSLLLFLGLLVLLPRFIFDAIRHGKYIDGFRERLGFFRALKLPQPVIWLHCVSVGETQAARPLVDLILREFPGHAIVVSTVTLTGQTLARQVFRDKAFRVFYFPFDWSWTVRRSLQKIAPAAVLLMETELWPNFMRQCGLAQIPVALVNGRLSVRSARRYRLVKNFVRRVVSNLDVAIMQTEADSTRVKDLGFPEQRIFVSGSLKFDAGTMTTATTLTGTLQHRFGLENRLILAASTHKTEERIILESFQLIREKFSPRIRLMVAPRHPERFSEVAALLKASGLSWKRRTEPETDTDRHCDVILLDTIGELTAAYPLASLVFVGGSIANFGGHNILEPAAVGNCVITGAHTHNFEAIVSAFVKAEAIVQLPNLPEREMVLELARVLKDLLGDPEMCRKFGQRAVLLVEENLGAAERTVNLLKRFVLPQGFQK